MKSGIYFIRNTINNKIYIGRSININSRLSNHRYQLRKNQHTNKHLQRSFNKYGEQNFRFFKALEASPERLPAIETLYINFLQTNLPTRGYNKTDDGGGYSKRLATEKRFNYWLVPEHSLNTPIHIESIQDLRNCYKENYVSNTTKQIQKSKYYCRGCYILTKKTGCNLLTTINKYKETQHSPATYYTVNKQLEVKEWGSKREIAKTLTNDRKDNISPKKINNLKYSFYKHKLFDNLTDVNSYITSIKQLETDKKIKEYKKLKCILENDTVCHMHSTFKEAAATHNLTYSLLIKRLNGIKGVYHKGYRYYYRPTQTLL
jgi:group I intron endonuclease